MAKRELSSTLKSLKFMQRASSREEKPKEEENPSPDFSFGASAIPSKRCMVIVEGNPHPGALKGRMSFQSFNPSIDKLNEETANTGQTQACVDHQNGRIDSDRVARKSEVRSRDSNVASPESGSDTDLKRKQQPEMENGTPPRKTQKQPDGDDQSTSSQNNRKGGGGSSYNQRKRERMDWNVLLPPKPQLKRS